METKAKAKKKVAAKKSFTVCEEETVKINPSTISEWKSDYNSVDNLLYLLRQDGALFLSTGINEFMIFDDQCLSLTREGLSKLQDFLMEHDRVRATKSSVFWGMFLDTAKAKELVFLPARLWEIGAKKDCTDLLLRAPISPDGGQEIVLQLARRYGDKLSKKD